MVCRESINALSQRYYNRVKFVVRGDLGLTSKELFNILYVVLYIID